jgi:hypothetical protein
MQYQLYLAGNGRAVVSTMGTPVPFSTTDTPCNWVLANALTTNAAVVVIGTSTANASSGSSRSGYALNAAENQLVPIKNLNEIWLDGASTEGISFVYYKSSIP